MKLLTKLAVIIESGLVTSASLLWTNLLLNGYGRSYRPLFIGLLVAGLIVAGIVGFDYLVWRLRK